MNRFKRNLFIGSAVSLLLIFVSAAASYLSIRSLLYHTAQVKHTNEVIQSLDSVIGIMIDAETGQRGFLLTGNDVFLDPYNGAYQKASAVVNRTKQLTSGSAQQQVDAELLKASVQGRLDYLTAMITKKRKGETITDSLLLQGKGLMDNVRQRVKSMKDREQAQLQTGTADVDRFSSFTPALIIVASLLSLFVAVTSFTRINTEFSKRNLLQDELQKKNDEVIHRLGVISELAAKIAGGNFSTRVPPEERESLGPLAASLDKMAISLESSFARLSDEEWRQTGVASLNEKLLGEKNLEQLTQKAIQYLTQYTGAAVGAFYLTHQGDKLQLSSSIGLDRSRARPTLAFGEGLAGQAALLRKSMVLPVDDDTPLLINYAAGSLKPKAIMVVPVIYENRLKGVIELSSLNDFSPVAQEFLNAAVFNIGTAIHSARDQERLQELLAETQAQAEELQVQHNELENVNSELEAQAERLQTSEEELRVQQEELQQANRELEERSRLLEEKNEAILERNLEIQHKAEELTLSTKYKSEFLANMSHELRTPLNSILLLSRLLSENLEKNLSADQVEYAKVIQSSGKGLLTLIDEILDLSKIEAGKMELEFADVEVDKLVSDLEALFVPLAKDKDIAFRTNIAPDAPQYLETDGLRLEQILRNLLSNAVKFTKQGEVSLTVKAHEEGIRFSVKDTGIGIAKEKQQSIFEAFQQADGSTRRQFGGTGLGLSISRELTKLLGGELSLQSEEGKGSEFTLVLPLKKNTVIARPASPTKALPEPVPASEKEVSTISTDDAFISEKVPASLPDDREAIAEGDKTILIIEDDTAFARSLLDYTRSKGYKGVVAVRGDEGIQLARRFKPLGILLDIQLPVKSGWQVMDELKADAATRPIPVHMMSSHNAKRESLSKGAVDFINKPVAFEKLGEMLNKIEQALNRHPRKVLIVEENPKHAQALAYFLESYQVATEITNNVEDGVQALNGNGADCVILDMGVPAQRSYELLEGVKKTPGLEQLPIIVFTGKNLSQVEERKIKQYADSIVVKTAHSYQRILDEVSLFLHLVEENRKGPAEPRYKRMGELGEVLKGKTILIADDDVRNIFSLTKSLENYGVNVISATDGKEALTQLEKAGKVDLVLMDMMMPEMDGYQSTRRIRESPKFRSLPVIAVTAKAMSGDREKCIAAGASDYITKPVDVDQLLSLLRVWLYS